MGFIKENAKGRIIDQSTGKPLVGAIVSNEKLNIRVETDENGIFTLTGSESDQLIITYPNYITTAIEGALIGKDYPIIKAPSQSCPKKYNVKNEDGICRFSYDAFLRANWLYILVVIIIIALIIEHHSHGE